MALGGNLDDLVFCEIFKRVDVKSLINCRLVSRSWNQEIIRMNRYTKKFETNSLILELDSNQLRIYNDVPKFWQDVPNVHPQLIKGALRHWAPPKNLNFTLNWCTQDEEFCQMMGSLEDWWCRGVKELEIVTYGDVKVSKVIQHLDMFPNTIRLSFSHYCSETLSCAEIFKRLPELRFFRLFGFNSNDGSGESSGLVFDDEAIDKLLKNQKYGKRRFQRLELFNTDILFSKSKLKQMLKTLGSSSFDPDMSLQSDIYKDPNEDVATIHILFDNCQWESMTEQDLLTSICEIAQKTNFPFFDPVHEPENNGLMGDFKFQIKNVNFVLKFTTSRISI